jgi:hypothetical protein
MTRSRLLVALLIAVAIGLAAGWISKQVVSEGQERTEDAPLDLRKQLHGEPPPRQ